MKGWGIFDKESGELEDVYNCDSSVYAKRRHMGIAVGSRTAERVSKKWDDKYAVFRELARVEITRIEDDAPEK